MADSREAAHARLVEAAKRLQVRGFFEHSDCADLATNRDMCAMRLALAQLSEAAAPQQARAPVGVEIRNLPALWRQREPNNGEEHTDFDKGYEQASDECADALERALAQQPADVECPHRTRCDCLGACKYGYAGNGALAGQQQGGTP